jgi:GTPase SAR1 family protein
MYGIFILGTAGSGKSLLTASLAEWLMKEGENVVTLNLDPGVSKLPYEPDIDIRNYISIDKLMDQYRLGPNGALVMASDLAADQVGNLNDEIEAINSQYCLVDTAGQMELFAFRESGNYLAKELKFDQKAVLYLFDAPFCVNPFNYVSTMFLSAAVSIRFMLPQLNVLSKIDLIPKKKLNEIFEWASSPKALETTYTTQVGENAHLLARDLFSSISRLRLDFSLIGCSSKSLQNFISLHAALQRLLTRGESER